MSIISAARVATRTDLNDAEWAGDRAAASTSQSEGAAARLADAGDRQCHLLRAARRADLASSALGLSAAYWLMLAVRDAGSKIHHLSNAEFATLRPRLLKLGARVLETASRSRLAFAADCSEAPLFRSIAMAFGPMKPPSHQASPRPRSTSLG